MKETSKRNKYHELEQPARTGTSRRFRQNTHVPSCFENQAQLQLGRQGVF
nr:MAG TPA: hypothetical protein [Caudoviricetes sp.]